MISKEIIFTGANMKRKLLKMTWRIQSRWQLTIIGCFCAFLLYKILIWHSALQQESEVYGKVPADHPETRNFADKMKRYKAGNKTSLSAKGKHFSLDGKRITIISGAVHYFRFPREYWRDRLIKMKACGLNTIETYVPWNKHEPKPGHFDFGGNLNITKFLLLAKELDFLVFIRPGPFICSEWEFGGMPAWLLRDPEMQVRTMYPNFINAVERYFDKLLPLLNPFQYKKGGPIVAMQLDNEYGAYFKDELYIPYLKEKFRKSNIVELLFVSDNIKDLHKQTVPGVLKTVNFKYVKNNFESLLKMQPDSPLMVMEFWTGWFDWWGDIHHTLSVQEFGETLNEILSTGASVNFYMFYGGTNFGFMNGGYRDKNKIFQADITSYDYDALISENGDLTPKYYKAKSIIAEYYPNYVPKSSQFSFKKIPRKAYENIIVTDYITIWNACSLVHKEESHHPLSMEMLNVNDGAGQAYGYALYTSTVKTVRNTDLIIGGFQYIYDRGTLFVDLKKKLFIDDTNRHLTVKATPKETASQLRIDILVENGGRINWMDFNDQRKGLLRYVTADGKNIKPWTIYAFEMTPLFIHQLLKSSNWKTFRSVTPMQPSFFKFTLYVKTKAMDTYIDMSDWGKGVVFVNGENLGRYWSIGPQKSLYLPAPWLHTGENHIVVFEEKKTSSRIRFSNEPSLS